MPHKTDPFEETTRMSPPAPVRDDPRVVVMIPVYNHPATLREVVEKTLSRHNQVMVVDDGSTESAAPLLEGLSVHLIRHSRNRGKGAAIMSAARQARQRGMTHMVTLDADGQHDPADLEGFLPLTERFPGAVIVGKRRFENTGAPAANRFGREVSNFWLKLQTGVRLGDVQSGFRVYPLFVLENLKLKETRYSFEVEVLVKAAWAGVPLMETDIRVHYPSGDSRISHFNLFLDNLRLTRLNTRLTLRAFLPWPHKKMGTPEFRSPALKTSTQKHRT